MPANTTAPEDKVFNACQQFGGLAAECADIVERLDNELIKAKDRIAELEEELHHPNKN